MKVYNLRPRSNSKTRSIQRYWSPEDHECFLRVIQFTGCKNYREIKKYLPHKTVLQVRTHVQKYLLRHNHEVHVDLFCDEQMDDDYGQPQFIRPSLIMVD